MVPPQAALLDRYRHPLVRDLAWLLLAPDLLALPWPGRPRRDELGFADDARLTRWLDALEVRPAPLEERVGEALRGRMGIYHERLWQFLLATAPGTRLLAHNLRIHRGKITLGELDLLYRQGGSPVPTHLEVAIKFYLGLPAGPGGDDDQARWIGPGGADSLASKREHLHYHQLRLSEAEETREVIRGLLASQGTEPHGEPMVRRRLAMPGALFYPWRHALPPPREATSDHLRGDWLPWRDWPTYRDELPAATQGARLRKPHWLALPRPDALEPLDTLEAALAAHFLQPAAPLQIALQLGDAGWRRLFLVADDWPRQIPLPPFQRGDADPSSRSSAQPSSGSRPGARLNTCLSACLNTCLSRAG